MKKVFWIWLMLLPLAATAQTSVTKLFRQGHEMMQQGKMKDASSQLFNSGFNVQRTSSSVVLGKSTDADIRLATRIRGSEQVDTVRMELRINTDASSLNSLMQQLGYRFVENRGQFTTWQNGAVKVAVFNPYNYKNYKVGFIFARDKNAPATTASVYTITVNGVSFKMIRVEGGTFQMGSIEGDSDEKPTHQVTLNTFSIGETEVTQELWQAVMGTNPSYFKGPKRPVEQVSWDDCQNFIRRLNQQTGRSFRLPTEAEWEYAARGGKRSNGYKYAGGSSIADVAWYSGNSNHTTHDVATKRANELGLYDMTGNVWEWCQDWYGSYSSGSQTNPVGASSGSNRVYRGGSWFFDARLCRVSKRSRDGASGHDFSIGLRLAF